MKRFLFAAVMLGSAAVFAAENVSFRTPDGVTLNALFSKPKKDKPVVILHHGLAAMKEEWTPLIEKFEKSGYGVLAYDARRAGTPWPKLVDDVGAAARYLNEKQGVPMDRLVFAGASLGANVCLKYAALTERGRGVILLSPGLDYQGLTTRDVIGQVKAPILIVAHPSDAYAYQSSMQLIPAAKTGEFFMSIKPGHGAQMFDEGLLKKIVSWLDKQK